MIDWAVASRRLAGESESGDAYVAVPIDGGMLLAVMDGLGHGHDAAVASGIGASTLVQDPRGDLPALFTRCHQALAGTRGAVMVLARLSERDSTVTWASVGDAYGVVARGPMSGDKRESVLQRPGILGHRLPRITEETLHMAPDDTLVLATDGLRGSFLGALDSLPEPRLAADHLLAEYGREQDDVLVLVARLASGESG